MMISTTQDDIILSDVSFSYGDHTVIEDISFSIPKSQIWGLVGRSGVGKTTLLQIIAGLYAPDSGKILIEGRKHFAPGRIKGVVFQDECLLGWLTVQENILFPNHQNPSNEEERRSLELINSVGLTGSEKKLPLTLSTGMRKRVEFARSLMVDDKYLLADEPFGTVDALTRRDLWKLWNEHREFEPRTGLLSTHDPEEAIRLCDAIIPLTSKDPAKIGRILHVPRNIKSLPHGENSDELHRLKKEVISLLA